MVKQIHEAFQDALADLDAGKTIEEALAAHPQYMDELRPLLETATSTATSTNLSDEQTRDLAHRSRSRMLIYASQVREQQSRKLGGWLPSLRNRFSFATLIVALIILLSSTGIWVASAQSVPGDPLYGLKRQTESLSRSLTTNDVSRYELDLAYRQRRVEEVLRLIELNRLEAVTFEGELLDQESGIWNIESILVIVHTDTFVKGPFKLGDKVQVNGVTTTAGAVLATSVELRRYHLIGRIEVQEDSFWVIAGRQLNIADAVIEPGVSLGALVDAEVEVDDEGVHRVRWLALLESPDISESLFADQTPSPTVEFVLEREFRGLLEGMSGSAIVVDGQTIFLGSDTEIEGVLFPGLRVRVEAGQAQDGSWIAIEIKVDAEEERDDDEEDDADSEEGDESGEESDESDDDDPDSEESEESDDHSDDDDEEEEEEEEDKDKK